MSFTKTLLIIGLGFGALGVQESWANYAQTCNGCSVQGDTYSCESCANKKRKQTNKKTTVKCARFCEQNLKTD